MYNPIQNCQTMSTFQGELKKQHGAISEDQTKIILEKSLGSSKPLYKRLTYLKPQLKRKREVFDDDLEKEFMKKLPAERLKAVKQ
jgi:hypothetical protein